MFKASQGNVMKFCININKQVNELMKRTKTQQEVWLVGENFEEKQDAMTHASFEVT